MWAASLSLYPRIRLSQGIDLADLLFPVLRTTELTVLDLLIELHTGVQHLTKDQPFEILEIKPNSEFGIEPHSAIIGQLISLCILQSRQPVQIQINPSRMQLQRQLRKVEISSSIISRLQNYSPDCQFQLSKTCGRWHHLANRRSPPQLA